MLGSFYAKCDPTLFVITEQAGHFGCTVIKAVFRFCVVHETPKQTNCRLSLANPVGNPLLDLGNFVSPRLLVHADGHEFQEHTFESVNE